MLLKNKKIVVTGGARGLGRAFAEAAIAAGAHVAIADILEERGRETAKETGAHFAHVDLGSPESIEACLSACAAALGGLDGLVNNGAIATGIGGKTMEDIDIATWDRVMTVNVRGTWLATRAALPWLKQSGQGKVVNIASYQCKPGDVVAARSTSQRSQQLVGRFLEMTQGTPASDWMTVDRDKMSGVVNRVPVREEINPIANEQLVVELYSR